MTTEQQKVANLLTAALECSVYVAPTDPGLTMEELFEVGGRLGLQQGEMSDALHKVPTDDAYGRKLLPDGKRILPWAVLSKPQDPDYRNWDAAEFVHAQMKAAVRTNGAAAAKLERSVLVEQGVARGLPRLALEAAITIDRMVGHFAEKDGLLSYQPGREKWPLPSEQRKPSSAFSGPPQRSEARARTYPIVKDVIERRSDGRPSSIEPLNAFAEQMEDLGHGPFRLWWKQTVAELRQADVQSAPVSATVLAAALVEGALTFVVRHARECGLPTLASTDFEKPPQKWSIDDLVKSAARGEGAAILDPKSRQRAEWLIHARQRIHAGRMLSEHPGGAPDYRPESAREAKATADLIVRRVLEWLERYPVGRPITKV